MLEDFRDWFPMVSSTPDKNKLTPPPLPKPVVPASTSFGDEALLNDPPASYELGSDYEAPFLPSEPVAPALQSVEPSPTEPGMEEPTPLGVTGDDDELFVLPEPTGVVPIMGVVDALVDGGWGDVLQGEGTDVSGVNQENVHRTTPAATELVAGDTPEQLNLPAFNPAVFPQKQPSQEQTSEPVALPNHSSSQTGFVSQVELEHEDEMSVFNNISRTLTVNEQPFFRWFKRVFIALASVSLMLAAFTLIIKAPWEIGLSAIGAVWVLVLAFSVPDAIIPYKKTRFNLTDNTVAVGQKKPRPIKDIRKGVLTVKPKTIKLWLGFSDKKGDGFYVPIKSNKFAMKREDLLVLRTVIPHTSIEGSVNDDAPVGEEPTAGVEVSQTQIVGLLENLMSTVK